MFWNKIPIVRLLIPYIVGILFGIEFLNNSNLLLYILFSFFVLLFFLHRIKVVAIIYLWGYLLTAFMIVLGYFTVQFHTQSHNKKHFSNYLGKTYRAKIVEPVVVKTKTVKLIVGINQVYDDNLVHNCIGKSMLYIKRDSLSEKLAFEDEILFKSELLELSPPQNPEEFDYKRYLSYHNISHQKYLQPKQWQLHHKNTRFTVLGFTNNIRKYFLSVFDKYDIKDEELGVVTALVLGYKENLTDELSQSYSSAGAMHVLAVSGLHVGIIYVIFNYLLFFLGKSLYQRIIKASILIFILWFYAALTGMSPSVMRAATMFTAVVIGTSMGYRTNIYNTLSASAIILLLCNPYLIVAVGFQLSYLAVLGIVFLQPKIYNLWFINNKWLDKIWAITSVSIAAQISTFPLGLFYFHQFPNYFLVSNLIVIPAATVILYLGIILLTFSYFTVIGNWIAWLLIKVVWLLNYFVKLIEILPYSMTQQIHISKFETILLYTSIIVLILLFTYRKFKYGFTFFSLMLILTGINLYDKYRVLNQKEFVVYNVQKSTAINFITGTNSYLFSDSLLLNDESKQRFHIKHYWWRNNINTKHKMLVSENYEDSVLYKSGGFYNYNGLKFLQLSSNSQKYINAKLSVDYLIISNNYNFKLDWLKSIQFKQVIFDSSNKRYKVEKWIKECEKMKIPYHSVLHSGAFVKEL